MIRIFHFCVITTLVLAGLGMASEIDGIWQGRVQGPEGDMELVINLKVNGDTLTGTVEGPMGEQPIQNGKIDGNKFSFDTEFDGYVITHQCSVSNDILTVSIAEFQMDMQLQRVPEIDIDGRWLGIMESPEGEMELVFVFKVNGENLTGSVESPMGNIPISNGKVNGSEFSFDVDAGGMLISHQCKYSGNSISMQVPGMDGGDNEIVLERLKIEE